MTAETQAREEAFSLSEMTTIPPHLRRGSLPDYYALLGVGQQASLREIERAYWTFVRGGDPSLVCLMNEAYEVLCHEERRAEYDERLSKETAAHLARKQRIRPRPSPSRLIWPA